jgi:putative aminopeptidase FrvX
MTIPGSLNELIKELDGIPGVSGYEEEIGEHIDRILGPISDTFYSDCLGNRIFIKKGKRPELNIMLCAHMDEIGFVVSNIDEDGFVYVVPAGLHDVRLVFNQVITIHTETGNVDGVTGVRPVHIQSKQENEHDVCFRDIYIDVGASSKEEALKLGVQIGDNATYCREGRFLNGNIFTGKAVDNRSGCTVLVEVMRRLQHEKVDPTVMAVATVQEEIGIRGAGRAAWGLQPDLALVIDVTFSGDSPDMCRKTIPTRLGKGPAIMLYDWTPCNAYIGNAVPKRLTKRLIETAENSGIPYQREVMLNGGTDAWAVSLSGKGILTGCLSIPCRYIHSATGCVNMNDVQWTADLIVDFIKGLKQKL